MSENAVQEKIEITLDLSEEKVYKTILHNDDTTAFEAVMAGLVHVYNKSMGEAHNIASIVHHNGSAVILEGTNYQELIDKANMCMEMVNQFMVVYCGYDEYNEFTVSVTD